MYGNGLRVAIAAAAILATAATPQWRRQRVVAADAGVIEAAQARASSRTLASSRKSKLEAPSSKTRLGPMSRQVSEKMVVVGIPDATGKVVPSLLQE